MTCVFGTIFLFIVPLLSLSKDYLHPPQPCCRSVWCVWWGQPSQIRFSYTEALNGAKLLGMASETVLPGVLPRTVALHRAQEKVKPPISFPT